MSANDILERLSCFRGAKGYAYNKNAVECLLKERYGGRLPNRGREESVPLYTTSDGETVDYVYKGHYFNNRPNEIKNHLLVCIKDKDGNTVKKIGVKEIWNLLSKVADKDPALVACVALVFYHLMNKTYHTRFNRLLADNNWNINERQLSEEKLLKIPVFPNDIIHALNGLVGYVEMADDVSISFEAFTIFWELCFIKDEYIISSFHSGADFTRKKICNLVIHVADYFMGLISYGDLLEMLADDTMERDCQYYEIAVATKGAVRSAEEDLIKALKKEDIDYIENCRLTIGDREIRAFLAIPSANIYVLSSSVISKTKGVERYYHDTGNRVFLLSGVYNRESFDDMLSRIIKYAKK